MTRSDEKAKIPWMGFGLAITALLTATWLNPDAKFGIGVRSIFSLLMLALTIWLGLSELRGSFIRMPIKRIRFMCALVMFATGLVISMSKVQGLPNIQVVVPQFICWGFGLTFIRTSQFDLMDVVTDRTFANDNQEQTNECEAADRLI